ncbi:APC family permease [Amycolatopsis palatopharyngis]|uniref:APC family permease n=1 Tax=Amycolatopsis palatopharyngis TaxID=187982 RepID=UPI000E27616B|nr:APC family permease [Amycolatopsis palatopharyngis]
MAAPAETPRKVEVALDTGLRRDVGKIGLLFTGVGAIIGSGWLFGALYASQIAGPAAILSWVIGAVIVMVIGLVYAELGAMFPVAGGIVRFPHYAFGSFTGYSVGWLSWLAAATVTPAEVLATTQYADPYIPWLMTEADGVPVLTGWGIVVSVALMFVYSLINVMGVKLFAQFNNVLVWWKLAVLALVVVMFLGLEFNPGNLTQHGFAPEGFGAVLTAIPAAGVAFAYLGFRNAVEYAAETDNPQKNVPFAIIWSIIICAVIYIALQIAFITGLPAELLGNGWSELDFADSAGPLAGLAVVLGATWLAILLRVDAVVSPADTGLIYAGVTTRLAYANARNGNAPGWLEKLNSRGIPWSAVILGFVVGCIFFLPFPGWQLFIGFITAAFAVSFGPGSVVVGALRRQLPDQDRPFRLPFGDLLPILAFYGSSMLVFWNEWPINEKMFVAFLFGYIVYALYHFTAKRELPPLDIKNGLWFPIWVLGIMVVSYLGDLDPTQPPSDPWILNGGDGPIGLGLGALILLGWSIAIYYYGVASRLSPERAAAYIQRLPTQDLETEVK